MSNMYCTAKGEYEKQKLETKMHKYNIIKLSKEEKQIKIINITMMEKNSKKEKIKVKYPYSKQITIIDSIKLKFVIILFDKLKLL